jgi:hypothetical protein
MVPQGNHLHQQSFYLSPKVSEWQQFSYCWTQASEVRPPTAEQREQFALRDQILQGMGSRHHYRDQAKMFDALCDRVNAGQEAQPKKLLKSKIQTSRAKAGLDTTTLKNCNVAQLALQTPMPEIWERPPSGPIRLGSDFTGY